MRNWFNSSDLLALNIDTKSDVLVARQNLNGNGLRAGVGQCAAIQIHGTYRATRLVGNDDLVRTILWRFHMSLMVNIQGYIEVRPLSVGAKKCLDLALPKTFPSETQPSVEVIDCQG